MSGCGWRRHTCREERGANRFAERSAAYRRSRMRAQRCIAMYFPFVALLSDFAPAAVLGVGAPGWPRAT